ncbi:Distal rod protein [Chromobacterium violaceum]|uniref:Distal rod protein n=1 Tax=Chromobacterium violaceum TaxID=536 RepID=A0A3S4JYP2_CHRVL|nr:Distal rod protein [Chromobacterium violaceum]
MMRALYIAKTGMDTSQFQLDVVSNNLANVNTVGFKKSRGIFEDLYYQTLRQPGGQLANGNANPTGLQVGTGAAAVASSRIFTQGPRSRLGSRWTCRSRATVSSGCCSRMAPPLTAATASSSATPTAMS